MTRLTTPTILLAAALCFAGCGGGKAAAPKPSTDAAPAGTSEPTGEPAGGEIGGEGHTHKEGTVATGEETVAWIPDVAVQSAKTHDGWTLEITSTPAAPALGEVVWAVVAIAPGGAAVTPGQLLIEPEAQETATGKKLALDVTQGEPGQAAVKFNVEAAGSYEVEFHLHRSDGGDSHVKLTFVVS